MNFPLFVAQRYFLSKRKKHFINIISFIAMASLALGSASLIIILSVFNGLEDLIQSLHNYFDPQLKIEAVSGKSFEVDSVFLQRVNDVEGVAVVTEVIEDNVYVKYRNSTMVVKLKGVSDNFIEQSRIDSRIVQGSLKLRENGINYAVLGMGVQYTLGIVNLKDMFALRVHYPNRKSRHSFNPAQLINTKSLLPAGVFAIEKQYDGNYIFAPLQFAADLMDYENRRSYLEIKVVDGYTVSSVKKKLKAELGEGFSVLDSEEQHASLIKAVKLEKLIVFLIVALIVSILSFNSFFSLTMLAIDKQKDISVLFSLGIDKKVVKRVFLWISIMISTAGLGVGLVLGTLVCIIQKEYGFVKLGMTTSVMDNYPVKILGMDYVYIILVITIITLLAAVKPARMAGDLHRFILK